MSVQYGRWNFDLQPIDPAHVENVNSLLGPYGPDGSETYSNRGLAILYRAFHTTPESHCEKQPKLASDGSVITWNGRLDNREDLIADLGTVVCCASTDVEIVSVAYQQYGTTCFAKLIGDWALSIWIPANRCLFLATDPIGTRHLYYNLDHASVTWCSVLDPLVHFSNKALHICEEYVAGFFGHIAATHLTPYVDIHSVPPSSYVMIGHRAHKLHKYWDFDPEKRIRYRRDIEYEEHFRAVFSKAIHRRLRSDRPVLAELSGGMDSSSIVCMADALIRRGEAKTERLDTISYYDNSDARLDELPYLAKVEDKRGRVGYHIDLTDQTGIDQQKVDFKDFFRNGFPLQRLAATPDFSRVLSKRLFDFYASYIKENGYRVLLSGSSGEDVTAGYVPSPIPELQDLVVQGRLFRLIRQLRMWAKKMDRPVLELFWETLQELFTHSLRAPWSPREFDPPVWFKADFVERNKAALSWYPSKLKLLNGLPSFQHQIHLYNHKRRVLSYRNFWPELPIDIRFPYLDRDLWEFACAVPRQQMLSIGKRRFLMKRALAGIVPDEILNRKPRFGAGLTAPTTPSVWPDLVYVNKCLIADSLGIIDTARFLDTLEKTQKGQTIPVALVKRTLCLESWFMHLAGQRRLAIPGHSCGKEYDPSSPEKLTVQLASPVSKSS